MNSGAGFTSFAGLVALGKEQGLWLEVAGRKALLARLTQEEAWVRHRANDHVPYRKGCPVCVAAQGRQRSHRRADFQGVFSASFDVAGPFVSGRSFDPVSSGRDRGLGYKYFLACAFTVPLPPVRKKEPPSDDVEVRASETEEAAQALEPVGDSEEAVALYAVTRKVRHKGPEAPEPVGEASEDEFPDIEALLGDPPPLPPPAIAPPDSTVEPALLEHTADTGTPLKTRTLCLGVPMRSKKGREVFGAVQSVINKLEAFGFPVHRYHADRAQELKSKSLVGWLRDRGIHGTWTPGENPAGNRAELAVQQLKGLARKLLFAAGLEPLFWPLAVLHASHRNWSVPCESLGVSQPCLLPFGLRLQARRRVKTGYQSHWRHRTVPGLYLGRAPDTPGGHLVLVDLESDPKVLLTNTIYPEGPCRLDPSKPRYRIKGKTAPDLVLKHVGAAAVPLTVVSDLEPAEARFAPGGGVRRHSGGF